MSDDHEMMAIAGAAIPYKELLAHLPVGIYFVDPQRKILHWNNGAEEISGYLAADIEGSHCWDNILVHVDCEGKGLCDGAHCPAVRAIEKNRPYKTEAFLRHKLGHRVPVHITTVPIHDEAGAAVGAVEIFSDQSPSVAVKEQITALEVQALTDPLTGIANRRHVERGLAGRIDMAHRYDWGFGALFLDIDDFKRVNDTHGHDAGDEALRVAARTLLINARSFDLAGRWGGEEFVVLSDNVDGPELMRIAERFRTLIEAGEVRWGDTPFGITVSIGATLGRQADTPKTLIERADALMYESKRSGKNRVTTD